MRSLAARFFLYDDAPNILSASSDCETQAAALVFFRFERICPDSAGRIG